jgi:hypothetical protein
VLFKQQACLFEDALLAGGIDIQLDVVDGEELADPVHATKL